MSRSGYYKWLNAKGKLSFRQEQNQNLKEHLIAIHQAHPYFGYPRMQIALRKKGWNVNHKRVYRLMKELKGNHSRKGNCLDNACIESFFRISKLRHCTFLSVKQKKNSFKP
ncbi:hypothetical protein ABD72_22560 [Brevibacillus laterosporus]|nr:hypothetical protein BrL25_21875 [Brevibacillus laterosporus DSM 25]MBG9804867.1 hypothetical protein [Brevibacillus laterosporus]